jgi:hypothetical protein
MSDKDTFLEHGPEFDGYESPRKAADGWDLVGWLILTLFILVAIYWMIDGSSAMVWLFIFLAFTTRIVSSTIAIFLRWMSAIYNSLSAVDPGIYPAKRKE